MQAGLLASGSVVKLDELIYGLKGPHTGMVDLEDLSDNELEQLDKVFKRLRVVRRSCSDVVY
jgi:hypothetical protein